MPVLDHPSAARHEEPGHLAPLPVVGGLVHRGVPDRAGVGLGHQEGCLLRGVHEVGQVRHGPGSPDDPPHRAGRAGQVAGVAEGVLHLVVGIAAGDVQTCAELHVVDAGLFVGDAGGDEPPATGDVADDVGLPADELRDQLGLEATPGQVVLGLEVALRLPQVVPPRQAVRPVDEAPLLVQALDAPVAPPQPVGEPLEHVGVVQQAQAGFVVDLEPDHRRMRAVASDDRADHPLGVEAVGRVREVHLLAGAPADPVPAAVSPAISGYIRVSHIGTA